MATIDPKVQFAGDLQNLNFLYERLIKVLDTMAGGYVYIEDERLNYTYIQLLVKIEDILDKKAFIELKKSMPENYESLLGYGEEIDMSWEYQRPEMMRYWGQLQKTLIRDVTPDELFDASLPEGFYEFLNQTDASIKDHKEMRKKAHEIFDKQISQESKHSGSSLDSNASEKNLAVLSFISISRPEITVGEDVYIMSSMRGGNAFKIIEYCLDKSTGKDVSLDTLKDKLQLQGVRNIKAALQHSHFDTNNGLLRSFVLASPGSIKVKRTAVVEY
jgi:hypothetical protein